MAKTVWKRAFRVGKLNPAQVARDQKLRDVIQAEFPPRVAFGQAAGMKKPDYDDPVVEERWCNEQRANVVKYLRSQKVEHGSIGDWPAWHVAPYVSIWAVESLPGQNGLAGG